MSQRRVWIPFAIAAVCLIAATWAGSILTWVLLLAALCLVLDGATAWFSRSSGGMSGHQQ
jgi:hypothetical protein